MLLRFAIEITAYFTVFSSRDPVDFNKNPVSSLSKRFYYKSVFQEILLKNLQASLIILFFLEFLISSTLESKAPELTSLSCVS